jgi:hypothetical protein
MFTLEVYIVLLVHNIFLMYVIASLKRNIITRSVRDEQKTKTIKKQLHDGWYRASKAVERWHWDLRLHYGWHCTVKGTEGW